MYKRREMLRRRLDHMSLARLLIYNEDVRLRKDYDGKGPVSGFLKLRVARNEERRRALAWQAVPF